MFFRNKVNTPTVIQMEAVECGAASLAIILRYFGKWIPLTELRIQCGVTRDGSNAGNIIQAARLYQLEGRGVQSDLSGLKELSPPFIVFWNFDHFLVVEGFGKKKIYLNDPASGPRTVSYEEFEQAFSGIALVFEPTADFKKERRTPSLYSRLEERLKGIRAPFIFVALCGFGLLFPGWGGPVIMQVFFDTVMGNAGLSWKEGVPLALLCFAIMAAAFAWLQASFLNRLNARLMMQYFGGFVWHILHLPVSFYSQRFGGEIAYRSSLNEVVAKMLTGNLASTVVNLFLIVFYAVIMFFYDWVIASIIILAGCLNLFFLWVINRSRKDSFARLQQEMGKSIGFAIGALQNIETIKSVGNEGDFFSRWAGYVAKKFNAQREIAVKDIVLTTLPLVVQDLAMAALLGIGAWRILYYSNMTIGILIAMQGFLLAFLAPVMQMVNLGMTIQTLEINISRLDDVLRNPLDKPFIKNSKKELFSEPLEGSLEFKDVSFGYSPIDPPLIKNLSFTLKPGQSLALVGPVGCGKSTIAKLASGLYSPHSGEILYDGKKKEDIAHAAFVLSLGSIDQQIFIFSGSIKDNLTLWDDTLSDEEIVLAAKDACIHDEILLRNNGYNAEILEGGVNFSGGERQRLEIARALVTSPRFLIMDEATSALDSKTEERILKNIKEKKYTTVMIAHRLSTIRDCDEIIVLDEGNVAQRGTHESLKQVEGLYRDLVMREEL